jgi:predicted secreted hydrolase
LNDDFAMRNSLGKHITMKRLLMIGLLVVLLGFGVVWAYTDSKTAIDRGFSSNLISDNSASSGFRRADGSHIWKFPDDFGPHLDYQTEWWYYTGNLRTSDGRMFGYQLTFFRRGLTPGEDRVERLSQWGANQVYMAHFALSDILSEEHYAFERFSRGAAGLAGADAAPFQVWLENWEVVELDTDKWRMTAEQEGIGLDLVLKDQKGVVFQGIDGYSQKGPEIGNASYYFSQTRLDSTGVVRLEDNEFPVRGWSWMDHEFSTSALSSGQIGWDWFSLQLDDGTDLMVFQIRREDGSIDPFSSGTVIDPEKETIHLAVDQFEIKINENWRSPHTGAIYPSAWRLDIPEINLTLDIQPYFADQEMNLSYSYWEGAVQVEGILGGKPVIGSGYVELTGYAASMENEF